MFQTRNEIFLTFHRPVFEIKTYKNTGNNLSSSSFPVASLHVQRIFYYYRHCFLYENKTSTMNYPLATHYISLILYNYPLLSFSCFAFIFIPAPAPCYFEDNSFLLVAFAFQFFSFSLFVLFRCSFFLLLLIQTRGTLLLLLLLPSLLNSHSCPPHASIDQ